MRVLPSLAPVHPRVISPSSGEPLRLDHVIAGMLASRAAGLIGVTGPPGSGKSTAIAHLAAVLPASVGLQLFDDPAFEQAHGPAASSLVVYAAEHALKYPHLAEYRLAGWSLDEAIEYLLARHKPRCASVMNRLRGDAELSLLDGLPELWTIVLERFAADETLTGVRAALERHIAARLAEERSERARRRTRRRLCRAALEAHSGAGPDFQKVLHKLLHDLGVEGIYRLLYFRGTRRVLAVLGAMDAFAGREDTSFLSRRLPRELVRDIAERLRDDTRAKDKLERIIGKKDSRQPMAASIAVHVNPGWRPAEAEGMLLKRAYLANAKWSSIRLPRADFRGADLRGIDLREAHLLDVLLSLASCQDASLAGALLSDCRALGADFSRADLRHIRAPNAAFRADFTDADLTGAVLHRASFRRAVLRNARLVRCFLREAGFEGADVEGADFTNADLTGANLAGLPLRLAEIAGACFTRANLHKCDLEGASAPGGKFEYADLSNALLTGSRMPDASFREADLRGAGLAQIDWEHANFRHADLTGATFHMGSSRSGLVFSPIASEGSRTGFYTDEFDEQSYRPPEDIRKANLRGADLRRALVEDVDFYLVDLRGAKYDVDQETHFKRCGAILEAPV